jgi:hypothetical protein
MYELSERQVNAFRLLRSHLSDTKSASITKIASDICGAQAQVLSAGMLSIATRHKNISKDELSKELRKGGKLVKTWAMRGTLYLLSTEDLPIYTRALGSRAIESYQAHYLKQYNVQPRDSVRLIEALAELLTEIPQTKRELSKIITEELGQWVRPLIESGWGGTIACLCKNGTAVFGPSRGQEVTFVRRDTWVKKWKEYEISEAKRIIARRFVAAYAPCDASDLRFWLGKNAETAREFWNLVADELAEVKYQGKKRWVLQKDIAVLKNISPDTDTIDILPHFDTFLLAHRKKDHFMDMKHYKKIFRIAGWISPTVILGGKVIGLWQYEQEKGKTMVNIRLFDRQDVVIKERIRERAADLSNYFQTKMSVSFSR